MPTKSESEMTKRGKNTEVLKRNKESASIINMPEDTQNDLLYFFFSFFCVCVFLWLLREPSDARTILIPWSLNVFLFSFLHILLDYLLLHEIQSWKISLHSAQVLFVRNQSETKWNRFRAHGSAPRHYFTRALFFVCLHFMLLFNEDASKS